ncbi:MAG: type VI secretion system tip protein VgrG [Bacteroidetes bacterium]|nr:type VI secretion system tip protein VgrG [Bacteroidota bacterium]MBL0138914.1 type VI secretion system tip protein VgrG [Bacteroidota bacterium]
MTTYLNAPEVKIQIADEEVIFNNLVLEQSVAKHHHFSFQWKYKDFMSNSDIQTQVMNFISKEVSITMGQNKFKGIITEISIEDRDDSHVFHISGQSHTILLEDAPRSTSYYKKPLDQIVKKSCGDSGVNVTADPENKDEQHYIAQYNETDFQFISRLATRFGEWFYYDGEKLNFGKTKNSGLTLQNGVDIQHITYQANLQPNKFSYSGTDAHKGEKIEGDMAALKSGDGFSQPALSKSKSLFARTDPNRRVHLLNVVNKKQLDITKDLDSKAATARALTVRGQSSKAELKPGHRFKISSGGNSPEYIVLSVTHSSARLGNYSNSFTAIPAKVEVPPYTNPHVFRKGEMQPAIVKDNKDSDKLDRVKIKFSWSEISPWVRIATPHSGKGKGWHFIPEIGEDVMVDFEGGDVDKPFIVGSLYTGAAKSGLGDDNNDIKSLKTRSGNTIIMNDKDGSITIQDAKGSVLILKGDDTIELKSKKKILIKSSEIDIKADNNINIQAGGELNLKSTKAMSLSTQDSMKQDSMKEFKVSTMDKLTTSSMMDTKISATMNLSLQGTVKAEMKGTMVSVQGTTMTEVKGAMVMIN